MGCLSFGFTAGGVASLAIDTSRLYAEELHKKEDTLKSFKSEFYLPEGYIYFSGHQLGPLTKRAKSVGIARLSEWELHGNGAWRVGKWMDIEDGVNDKLAAILNVSP